jgi:hypothetical protein
MFLITWMFDKLGYMPKIDMQVGKVVVEPKIPEFTEWPFPAEDKDFFGIERKKPAAKKATVKKPAVVAKTARAKKIAVKKTK